MTPNAPRRRINAHWSSLVVATDQWDLKRQAAVLPPKKSSYVLQRVRKDGDETGVVRRSRDEISISLVAGKEDRLRRPRATICLNPAAACAVYSSSPKANRFGPERGVGYFQHNAAHVLVDEEIVAGELKVVQGATEW